MGSLTLREGCSSRKTVEGVHLEEIAFPVCARQEQWFSMHGGPRVLGWPDFLWKRSDREVGLCHVLGDFILWCRKHLHMPAGRWWGLEHDLKVTLCSYGMFSFKMRKATYLFHWELELSRGGHLKGHLTLEGCLQASRY